MTTPLTRRRLFLVAGSSVAVGAGLTAALSAEAPDAEILALSADICRLARGR